MTYDYIFAGFGLSTMLLIEELSSQGLLDGKSLLILEKQNDFPEQTWCFWEAGAGKWDKLLSGKWEKGFFEASPKHFEILRGLTYKSISAETLRNYILATLQNYDCSFINEQVIRWTDKGNSVSVRTAKQAYQTRLFFNSGYDAQNETLKSDLLLQHFVGWYIRSDQLLFDPSAATIMDFSIAQKGNTRFMYVLPFSKKEALVEYTLFSPALIAEKEYADEIRKYLMEKGISEFEIVKKETGVVPMTTHPFWKKNTANVLHIGTAGGWTKASTGYTFSNATRLSRKAAQAIKNASTDFRNFHQSNRFAWYDRLFIDVLCHENAIGKKIFTALFSNGDPSAVMRFLNEETRPYEEIRILLSCPKRPFLSALWRTLLKK